MNDDSVQHATRSMRCMEIHGGSQAVEEEFDAPGLDEWIYSRPHQSALNGGDVRYVSLCGGGVISRLILADISGHGIAVADVALALRDLMKKNINVKDQRRLVRDLNRQFAELVRMERFATAVVATYLATHRSLTICNAGHPRPLRRRAVDGSWEFLGPSVGAGGNLPWGIDEESPYHQFSVNFEVGDTVLFYTDALIEATAPTGEPLGEAGLLGLARGLDDRDPLHVGRADLLDAVAAYRGGAEADDDVTLVAWHHNASGPRRPSAREKIDVYGKVFGLKSY